MDEKRLLLLMNPCSGQRKANRVMPEIIRTLSDEGWRVETYITKAEGDATVFAAAHGAEFGRIVCVGGDGTLNETIAGVLRGGTAEKTPIGYIPGGTTNDYASSVGLSADPVEAAKTAAKGQPFPIDIGEFNGRSFTYTASCGAFARVSYTTPQVMKNMLGHLAYVLEGIKDLSTLRPYRLRVTAGTETLDEEYLFCCVSNSTSVGGMLKLDASAVSLNDGLFEVMLVKNPENPAQLAEILNALASKDLPCDMIRFFKASDIAITSGEPIEWTLDGERAEAVREAVIHNMPRTVTLIVPEKETEENDPEEKLSD